MQALRHYLLAVQFFTRIPVTGRLADWVGYSPAMLRASAAPCPGLGWLAALLSTGIYAALHWALAPSPLAPAVAAVFCTIATVLMTGGFHEDGLADVADGLGGSADRERALDIMKDSRIGAFGAMALVQPAACGRHRPVQKQAAGRPDFGRRAAGGIFVVFYAASACLSSAISYLFYSVCTLQRPCRRLDGPLVRAQAAGFYRRLPGCHAAGQRNRLLPGRGAGLALDVTGAPPKTRLWLVRHAQPLVAPGTCYGALDIPADPAATRAAAEHLAAALPPQSRVIHSTLQRCEQLALELQALRPDLVSKPDARLREMDFGSWEGQAWESIARSDIDAWTAAFASYRPGLGENLAAVLARVAAALQDHDPGATQDVVWITHAGVIRSVAWLKAHGNGVLPRSEEWPVAAPGWGEWERTELG
jgi:alpha-ribazole phosphatase